MTLGPLHLWVRPCGDTRTPLGAGTLEPLPLVSPSSSQLQFLTFPMLSALWLTLASHHHPPPQHNT